MKFRRRNRRAHAKAYGRAGRLGMGILTGFLIPAAAVAAPHVAVAGKPVSTGGVLQMLAGLILVVGLVLVLAWAMRRFGRLSPVGGESLRVLGALSMGARERVVLIQAGETQLLVGVAPGRVQTLHVLDRPIDTARQASAQVGFGERLRQVMSRGNAQ